MTRPRDDGEPESTSRRDASAEARRARQDVLILVTIFVGVLLVNGLLTVLLIAGLEALGWWNPTSLVEWPPGAADGSRWRSA